MPRAESSPGSAGTITWGMLRASAKAQAWRPPAPPKATRAKWRGIAGAFNGDNAEGVFHGGVDHADDSGGELVEGEADSLPLEKFLRDAAGAVEIESEVSAEKASGLQAAEEEIRVCHRGLRAASVADGAGIGSGGFGADAEYSGGVEAGEGTSTGADGVDVEHGDADGEAGDLGVGGGFDFDFDKGDVGGGASHVEGDDAIEAAGAGGGGGADDTSGGAGEDGADGFAGGGGESGDAAGGLHDEDARGEGFRLPAFGFR